MSLRIVEMPSPNRDERGCAVDMLVLHYTGMKTAQEALARLTDPASRVSAHYTIDRDGRIFRHVPEDMRAWHAGVSYWAGETDINARAIGIELVNPGHEFGYVPFADEQIAALIDLCDGIFARHRIAPARVVGHSDVAPARKEDPGELFPWKCVADYGIGLWPGVSPPARGQLASAGERAGGDTNKDFAAQLADFGYGVPPQVDWPLEKTVAAFQRRFRPSCINGIADSECENILNRLLEI